MKNTIMRIIYAILGVLIGIKACNIWSETAEVGFMTYLIFILLGVAFSLAIKEEYLNTEAKQLGTLVISIALYTPIAYVLQYLVAVIIFLKDIALWLLQFEIVIIGAIVVAILFAILLYDTFK